MANHEAVAAYPVAPAPAVKQLARDMAVRRMAYVVSAASEVPSLVAVDPASAASIVVITCLGRNYLYDSTDTTTAHDGTTTLVSVEGRRYKLASNTEVMLFSVINVTTSAPPGSPTLGDAYLIAAGATGAWAGHSNELTVWTARGWEFVVPAVGRVIYNRANDAYYHKNAGGSWILGWGSQAIPDNTVKASNIISKPVRWIVTNQTTNTPPAASLGATYIVGSAPTGAWAGQALKIAISEDGSTWTFYTPRNGEAAYDQALNREVIYNGTVWASALGGMVLISTQVASTSATIDFSGLDDTFDHYQIIISGLKTTANDVGLAFRWQTADLVFQATANYRYGGIAMTDTGTVTGYGSGGSVTQFVLMVANNAAAGQANGEVNFDNPEATDLISLRWNFGYQQTSTNNYYVAASGYRSLGGPYVGCRFLTALAGNISTGRFSLYGFRKS